MSALADELSEGLAGRRPGGISLHAILQMEERGLTVEDILVALVNGEDVESRPSRTPARLVLGTCRLGLSPRRGS